MAVDDLVIGLAGALVGVVVGGFISSKAIAYAHFRHAQKQAKELDAKKLLNLFRAIQAELSLVWQRYMALLGDDLEKGKESEDLTFAGFFLASQHYFSVYDHSAQLMGVLDPESCRQIIDTYVNLKAYFDEWNQYSLLADKQRQVRLQANINLYESRQIREELGRYFEYLKKRHLQVKGLCHATLETLKEFSSLAQQARTKVEIKI